MSNLANDVKQYHNLVSGGGWGGRYHIGLHKKTVGILGLGRIGSAFARRCRGFEMQILGYDPLIPKKALLSMGIKPVSLESLLKNSDFVSIHAPRAHETENLINETTLALMKPTGFLINTSRGDMIDEVALKNALSTGIIAGAGLDVFEFEPQVSKQLMSMENTVLMPHAGSATHTTRNSMVELACENITNYLLYNVKDNLVNKTL